MGRRHTNRRGKKSRSARKKALRSHDPELNPNFGKAVIIGRNAAPAKTDESVLNTVPNVKVREDAIPKIEVNLTHEKPRESKPALDRHSEMRRRGEEKRLLMASLCKGTAVKSARPAVVEPVTSNAALKKPSRFAQGELNPAKRNNKRKIEALFENVDSPDKKIKIIDGPEKPTLSTIHSAHKRKKMRDRERAKREKLRLKKEAKAQKHKSMISTKRNVAKFNEALERPADSIRQMGMMLAKKLGKDATSLKSAYESIS